MIQRAWGSIPDQPEPAHPDGRAQGIQHMEPQGMTRRTGVSNVWVREAMCTTQICLMGVDVVNLGAEVRGLGRSMAMPGGALAPDWPIAVRHIKHTHSPSEVVLEKVQTTQMGQTGYLTVMSGPIQALCV